MGNLHQQSQQRIIRNLVVLFISIISSHSAYAVTCSPVVSLPANNATLSGSSVSISVTPNCNGKYDHIRWSMGPSGGNSESGYVVMPGGATTGIFDSTTVANGSYQASAAVYNASGSILGSWAALDFYTVSNSSGGGGSGGGAVATSCSPIINSPANNATLSGSSVSISVSPNCNGTFDHIRWSMGPSGGNSESGFVVMSGGATTGIFDSTTVPNGSYQASAAVYNSSGSQIGSWASLEYFTVSNSSGSGSGSGNGSGGSAATSCAPVVNSPANNATISGSSVSISVSPNCNGTYDHIRWSMGPSGGNSESGFVVMSGGATTGTFDSTTVANGSYQASAAVYNSSGSVIGSWASLDYYTVNNSSGGGGSGGSGGGIVEIDDTDSSIIYSSPNSTVGAGWNLSQSSSQDYNSTEHYNNFCVNPAQSGVPIQGAMAVENFSGTAITLIGKMGPNYGIGAYAIDGVPLQGNDVIQTVNAYSPSTLYQQPLVTISGLPAGSHVLSYQVTCNTTGSDFYQVIDGYKITGSALPVSSASRAAYNQVNYTGVWSSGGNNNTDLSDGHAWSNVANSTVSWTFTGSLIEVFGRPDVGDGIFTVTIDGQPVASVDGHYSNVDNDALSGYLLYAKKLSSGGSHTIVLTVTGTTDSYNGVENSGQGGYLQFDEFLAFP